MNDRDDENLITEALSSMHGDIWIVCRTESGLLCRPVPRGQTVASWAERIGKVLYVGDEVGAAEAMRNAKTLEKVLES